MASSKASCVVMGVNLLGLISVMLLNLPSS
jgi:hypothetical protein